MENFDLNLLAREIHENAKAKGFWDSTRNRGELFMLMVSELGEALEAHRKGKFAKLSDFEKLEKDLLASGEFSQEDAFIASFMKHVKDTFEDEIADVVIRILDYVGWRQDVEIKLEFYEELGDFQLFDPNVGETLMEVNVNLAYAFQSANTLAFISTDDELNFLEKRINASLILLFNLSVCCEYQLLRHIKEKMKFNQTRERLHGKAY